MMKALITGASSGIGREMAKILHQRGAELILAARSADWLEALKAELGSRTEVVAVDLSDPRNATALFEQVRDKGVNILINNAGFGTLGEFSEIPLENELEMINLNVTSLHILTKLFLEEFEKSDSGYIMNVASIAGFLSGPLMATYYATKGYVLKLSLAISEELRQKNNNVSVSVLCPGPVATDFDSRAGVTSSLKGLPAKRVADYAIRRMFKKKALIIPGFSTRAGIFFQRFAPNGLLLKICYGTQNKKRTSK